MVHNVICAHVNDQMGKVVALSSVVYIKRHRIYRSTFDTNVKLRKIDFKTNIVINCIIIIFFYEYGTLKKS